MCRGAVVNLHNLSSGKASSVSVRSLLFESVVHRLRNKCESIHCSNGQVDYEETTSRYPFSGSRYAYWKTGLLDIHPRKPDFPISILDNRTSGQPFSKEDHQSTKFYFRSPNHQFLDIRFVIGAWTTSHRVGYGMARLGGR
jgi:hypothetical protein